MDTPHSDRLRNSPSAGQDPIRGPGQWSPLSTWRHLSPTDGGGIRKYEYARRQSHAVVLEEQMASLEDAGFAYAFASGLAAEDACCGPCFSR